jgi:hypothetical protein
MRCLIKFYPPKLGVRLLGLTLSGLVDHNEIAQGATLQEQFTFD